MLWGGNGLGVEVRVDAGDTAGRGAVTSHALLSCM